jgi:antitoxin YefM
METTYTQLRDKLASVLDRVTSGQEVVIVRRKGSGDVALIPADELSAIMETAHLLRSPKNASRLLRAFRRAGKGLGKPETLDKLRREMKIESRN